MSDSVELPFDDERTNTKVRCRICGKWVTYESSRLYFSFDGTYRTCKKGNVPHDDKPKART